MTRGGRAQDEDGSQRTCIVTRAKLPPDELLRFVLAPDGQVVPDLKRKLPGRGVWVQATAKGCRRGGAAQGVHARLQGARAGA